MRNISRRAGGLQYWMDTAFCAQSLRCWLRVILEVIFQVVKAPIEVVHSKCEETIPSEAPYTFAMYKYDKDEERETQQSHYPADYTKSWQHRIRGPSNPGGITPFPVLDYYTSGTPRRCAASLHQHHFFGLTESMKGMVVTPIGVSSLEVISSCAGRYARAIFEWLH